MSDTKKIYRIAVDLFDISNRNVGLGEFTYQLGAGLAARADALRRDYGVEFYFIVPASMKGVFGPSVRYLGMTRLNRRLLRFYPLHFDLLHISHQHSRLKRIYSAEERLLTVHDINFVYEKSGERQNRYAENFRRRLKGADYLSFISFFSQADVLGRFGVNHPHRVIYNGVTDLALGPTERPATRLPEGFLLHISSLQPKKNPHLLVEMMRYLPQYHLVVVGNWESDYGRRMRRRISDLELRNVTPLNHVSEREKAWLFAHCRAFLFPSLCEGFGLPPMEALCFGKPVFLSSLTSLPEVGGSVAYYWDDLSPEAMADRVKRGLEDAAADLTLGRRAMEWVSQFSWERCIDGYVECYLDLLHVERTSSEGVAASAEPQPAGA
ncbi:MAG: glycosyltransferase family 4 protein [Rikenellaceae bacterium]|nr:glycosyltransferase family 4 protein [Rikenellaceae bacterium]